MSLLKRFIDFVDVRLGVREIAERHLTGYRVPRNVNAWYAMGGVLLALFTLQVLTGLMLLAFYIPTTQEAFASVERIMNEVPYGWLIRYLHAVGANIIVFALLLHMLSVLFMASYKSPREFNWLSGFILLNISFGLCLTGYLLPWSQLSYWATTVATSAPGAVPVVGDMMVEFLRGGSMVGQATLGRFFALHVVGFPLALAGLVGAHLFFIRRTGISTPPFGRDYRPASSPYLFGQEGHPDGIPFFPHYALKDLSVVCFFLALLMAITCFAPGIFFPEAAFHPADPFVTPEGIKPEWYFLWAYQTLKMFPSEIIGLGIQGLFMTLLALLPFIDRGAERRPARRPVFVTLYLLGILGIVAISVWGHYS